MAKAHISEEHKQKILQLHLNMNTSGTASRLAEWFGKNFVDSVFDWADTASWEKILTLGRDWGNELTKREENVRDWMRRNPTPSNSSLLLLCQFVDPRTDFNHFSPSRWTDFANSLQAENRERIPIRIHAFLLCLGFTRECRKLIELEFSKVHEATADGSLSEPAILLLEKQFEGMRWTWDQCKILRKELVRHYARHDWPAESLFESLRGSGALRRILETWGWGYPERQYLRDVLRQARYRKVTVSPEQSVTLDEYGGLFWRL
jgi:hypothetical protein